ncbi:DinB family protein [Lapillicoccus jejuensis]|uniref:DinB family protein n=1 Tax=Lapillicoccus jejuensis TaxID=402171 RepID=A0A542DZE2_9MICO|nr:DinB family protein [Lapillicoccus jejuensis]TQJ08461.1 DinB family protein [Lapillicoccus jejuensis]
MSEPREFHSEDLTGTRFVRSRMPGAFFHELRMPGTTFHDVDLSGSTFRSVGLVDVRVVGSHLKGLSLDGEVEGPLLVNGIDVTPYVDAQLEERHPERALLRPQDAAGFRRAWDVIEQDVWAPTIERARRIAATDPDRLHASVGGEWSFTQTLRHLDFALDCWVSRVLMGIPLPWHDLDLPWDEAEPVEGMPWDKEARPDLETVLANRAEHHAVMRAVLDDLTDEQLAGETTPVDGPGHPEARAYPVRMVLQVVLDEEWWHHRFAVRDLDALEPSPGPSAS